MSNYNTNYNTNYNDQGRLTGLSFSMEGTTMEVLDKITYTHSYWTLLLPIIMMGADVLTGWIQASVNGTWDSTKMRKGLFRKSGEIVILVLAYVVQIAIALPINIFMFISIYVCVMEVLSVIENLDQAGLPVPAWITRRLKKAMDTMVSGGEEEEHMEHQEHKEDTEE